MHIVLPKTFMFTIVTITSFLLVLMYSMSSSPSHHFVMWISYRFAAGAVTVPLTVNCLKLQRNFPSNVKLHGWRVQSVRLFKHPFACK